MTDKAPPNYELIAETTRNYVKEQQDRIDQIGDPWGRVIQNIGNETLISDETDAWDDDISNINPRPTNHDLPAATTRSLVQTDILELAKDYLAKNAAESGADELIRMLVGECQRLRSAALSLS